MPPRVAGISRMPGRIRPERVADFVGIRIQLSASLYEILQILSLSMFERMPIDQLLSLQPGVVAEPASANQLTLFD